MDILVPTAAIISIGDEILRGDTEDSNMQFLIRELSARGVAVKRGIVIPDEFDVIVNTVRDYSEAYDHVIVGGGIGPTPDDLTRPAVAEALGRELELNREAAEEYSRRRGTELNPGQLEMCRIPVGSELIWSEFPGSPSFIIENVVVFPGVPDIMRAMWATIADRFRGPEKFEVRFKSKVGESRWRDAMADYVARYPEVSIGSYPKMKGDRAGWHVEVVVHGYDKDLVEEAASGLEERIRQIGLEGTN